MQEIRWINFNMGCFEILAVFYVLVVLCRLTLTWDVLKFFGIPTIIDGIPINFNMGCFEIVTNGSCTEGTI